MADLKISALTASTTPLAGTEVLPIVQSSTTKQVSVANLTVGRDTTTGRLTAGTGVDALTGNGTGQVILSGAGQTLNTPGKPTLYHKNGVGLGVYSDYAIDFEVNGGTSKVVAGKFTDTGNLNVLVGNVVIGTSGKGVTTGSSIPLGFGTNTSTTQAIIDTSGNFIIGTTTALGKLTVTQGASSNTDTIALLAATAAAAGSQPGLKFYNSSSAAKAYMFWDTNTDRTYVQTGATGGVYLANGGTSWTSASDERLKDIIEPITDAVNKVSTLRAVIGKYKTDEEGTRRSFLIAQDVQAVLPEAVSSGCMPASDDPTEYLGVAYTEVIPLLVAAIKEQQVTIENLKSRLDSANI